MRKYFIAGLLFLATIAPEGCIFEPRTPQPPGGGTDVCPWITPNRPKDVFVNLKNGFACNLDSNYERSLDPAFIFIPYADAVAVYPLKFAEDWTKAVELTVLTRIKTLYVGTRSVQFGDANLNFRIEDERVGTAIFTGEYAITVNLGDGSPALVYTGEAVFTIVQGTQGWVLSKWEDTQASGTNPTSGILRGALRP